MLNRPVYIFRSHTLTSLDVSRSHLVLQIMAFQCFKIQLQKIESAPENFGEHNVTGILVHHISETALMWTQSIRIFADVSSGLSYLHNNKGKTWFSLMKTENNVMPCFLGCDLLLSWMDTRSTLS